MQKWQDRLAEAMQARHDRKLRVKNNHEEITRFGKMVEEVFITIKTAMTPYGEAEIEIVDSTDARLSLIFTDKDQDKFTYTVELRSVPAPGYRVHIKFTDEYGKLQSIHYPDNDKPWYAITNKSPEKLLEDFIQKLHSPVR